MKELKRRSFFWMWVAFFIILVYDADLVVDGTAISILVVLFMLIKMQNNSVNKKATERRILRYNTRKELVGGAAITTAIMIWYLEWSYVHLNMSVEGELLTIIIGFAIITSIHSSILKHSNSKVLAKFIERSDYNDPKVGRGVTIKDRFEARRDNGKVDLDLLTFHEIRYRGGLKLPEDVLNEDTKKPRGFISFGSKGILLEIGNNVGVMFGARIPNWAISEVHLGVDREYYRNSGKRREFVKDILVYIDLIDGRRAELAILEVKPERYDQTMRELNKKMYRGYDVNTSRESIVGTPIKEVEDVVEFSVSSSVDTTAQTQDNSEVDKAKNETLEERIEKDLYKRMLNEEKAYDENIKSKSHMFTEKYSYPLSSIGMKPLYNLEFDKKVREISYRVIIGSIAMIVYVKVLDKLMENSAFVYNNLDLLLFGVPAILVAYAIVVGSKFKKTKTVFNDVVDLYNKEEEFSTPFYKDSLKLKAEEVYEKLPNEDRVIVMSAITNYMVKNYPITLDRLSKLYSKDGVDEKVRGNHYLTSIYVECLIRCGRFDDALDMLESLKKVEGLRIVSETFRAEALMNKGRAQEAIEIIDSVFNYYGTKGKKIIMVKYVQGKSYYRLGELEKALEIFKDIYKENDRFEDVSVLIENIEGELGSGYLLTQG